MPLLTNVALNSKRSSSRFKAAALSTRKTAKLSGNTKLLLHKKIFVKTLLAVVGKATKEELSNETKERLESVVRHFQFPLLHFFVGAHKLQSKKTF